MLSELSNAVLRTFPLFSTKGKTICFQKKASGVAGLFREGISFFMGYSKNYIMYWGGTSSNIA